MNVVIFDVETTGLDPQTDVIIQFSACDLDGNELFNSYIRPTQKHFSGELLQHWIDAAKINNLHPFSREITSAPIFTDIEPAIQKLFDEADMLIAYNGQFDIKFLAASGIQFKEKTPYYDVMLAYAEYNGEWSNEKQSYKWKRLGECAAHFGYNFKAHDSMEDVRATAVCCKKLLAEGIQVDKNRQPLSCIKEVYPDPFTKEIDDDLEFGEDLER